MVWFSVNHHKASPLGPISGLAIIAIAVLNGFKVTLFVATTKLSSCKQARLLHAVNSQKIAVFTNNKHTAYIAIH